RVNLVADVDPVLLVDVEDRLPALAELGKGFLDQACWPLRPRIEIGKRQRARERHRGVEPEIARGLGGRLDLFHGPFLPCLGVVVDRCRRESIELGVVSRMHGHQLPLKVRRELGDLDARLVSDALDLVAIVLRRRCLLEVEQASVPGRDLYAFVAEARRPFGDGFQRVERRLVARKLRKEYPRPLHRRWHRNLLLSRTQIVTRRQYHAGSLCGQALELLVIPNGEAGQARGLPTTGPAPILQCSKKTKERNRLGRMSLPRRRILAVTAELR